MHKYVLKPVHDKVKKHEEFLSQYKTKNDQAQWVNAWNLLYHRLNLVADPLKVQEKSRNGEVISEQIKK